MKNRQKSFLSSSIEDLAIYRSGRALPATRKVLKQSILIRGLILTGIIDFYQTLNEMHGVVANIYYR